MRRKGQTTTLEERIEIGERWEAGQTDRECQFSPIMGPVVFGYSGPLRAMTIAEFQA